MGQGSQLETGSCFGVPALLAGSIPCSANIGATKFRLAYSPDDGVLLCFSVAWSWKYNTAVHPVEGRPGVIINSSFRRQPMDFCGYWRPAFGCLARSIS